MKIAITGMLSLLACLGAGPATKPAKPSGVIAGVSASVARIPERMVPKKGKSETELEVAARREWIQKNMVGMKMAIPIVKVAGVKPIEKSDEAQLDGGGEDKFAGVPIEFTVRATVPPAAQGKLSTVSTDDQISLLGTVAGMELSGELVKEEGRAERSKWILRVNVSLKDASMTRFVRKAPVVIER